MSPPVGLAVILLAPVLVVALAGPRYDEPTPPIGWWAVIVVAALFGAVIGAAVHG